MRVCPKSVLEGVSLASLKKAIVTLVPECIMSSHGSLSMYKNFKIVIDCAIR